MEGQDRDDARLAGVFTAAAEAAPPPTFGHADVLTASRRATARRRSALVGGAVTLFAVAGIGSAAVVTGSPGDERATSAAAPARADAAPEAAPPAAASGQADSALRGAPAPGPPLGPGDRDECANRQDPQVRALLEQVLPEVAGAPEAVITMECRPGGERGVNLEVTEGGATGVLTVEYLPPWREPGPVDPGLAAARMPTASGGTVTVYSSGHDGAAPFADRLDLVAVHLAPRL